MKIDFKKLAKIAATFSMILIGGTGLTSAHISLDGFNGTTGPYSENINDWEIENEAKIDIDNNAFANTDYEFMVDTGCNEIERNTLVEDIETGDIAVDVQVKNELNNSDFDLAFGEDNSIALDFSNHLTGPFSENVNRIEVENERNIDIDNNAHVSNDLDVYANTGKNEIEHNTVVGDVETGDIQVSAQVKNVVNQNAGDIDLSNLGETSVSADFSNAITGPDSSNINTAEVENKTNVNIDNNAIICNDIDVAANTGGNKIEGNTVVGDVSTGSIQIDAQVLNQAN